MWLSQFFQSTFSLSVNSTYLIVVSNTSKIQFLYLSTQLFPFISVWLSRHSRYFPHLTTQYICSWLSIQTKHSFSICRLNQSLLFLQYVQNTVNSISSGSKGEKPGHDFLFLRAPPHFSGSTTEFNSQLNLSLYNLRLLGYTGVNGMKKKSAFTWKIVLSYRKPQHWIRRIKNVNFILIFGAGIFNFFSHIPYYVNFLISF